MDEITFDNDLLIAVWYDLPQRARDALGMTPHLQYIWKHPDPVRFIRTKLRPGWSTVQWAYAILLESIERCDAERADKTQGR